MKKYVVLKNQGNCYIDKKGRKVIECTVCDVSVVFESNDLQAVQEYYLNHPSEYDYNIGVWYVYGTALRKHAKNELRRFGHAV